MKTYLGLELKKFNMRRRIKGILIVILGMLLFETLGVLNSQGGARDSFDLYFPYMVNLLTTTCFIIYSSVFTTQLIIGEYTNKTILILFSYPINRRKIILLKAGMVSCVTMLCIVAGNLFCHLYIIGLDTVFDIMAGAPGLPYLAAGLRETAFGALMGGILCLLPFAVGMWKKSNPATFISSVLIAGIFMEAVGIAPKNWIVVAISAFFALISLLAVKYTLSKQVENLDDGC